MGFRLTALLMALALVAPTAAFAGGLPCDDQPLVMASCCCDPPGELRAESERAPAPAVEATCCCSVEQAPANGPESHDGLVPESAASKAPAATLAATPVIANDPAPVTGVAVPLARGPPPARSLLSQRTSFLC